MLVPTMFVSVKKSAAFSVTPISLFDAPNDVVAVPAFRATGVASDPRNHSFASKKRSSVDASDERNEGLLNGLMDDFCVGSISSTFLVGSTTGGVSSVTVSFSLPFEIDFTFVSLFGAKDKISITPPTG